MTDVCVVLQAEYSFFFEFRETNFNFFFDISKSYNK